MGSVPLGREDSVPPSLKRPRRIDGSASSVAGKRFAKNTESPLEFEGPTLKEPYFEAPVALFDLKS